MRHHTKDKGDIGVACVIADLMKNGIQVCLPMSEHLPFDLIAVSPDMLLKRIQVKYLTGKNGAVRLELISNHSDSRGNHKSHINLNEIDAYALYCPEQTGIHYLRKDGITTPNIVVIRTYPPKINQKTRRWEDSIDPYTIFK